MAWPFSLREKQEELAQHMERGYDNVTVLASFGFVTRFGLWLIWGLTFGELEIDFYVGVQKWMNECFEGIFEMWIQWAMAHSLSSPLETREEDKALSKPMVGFCSVV